MIQFTNKQPIAALFIGLSLVAIGSQPSQAYSVQDLQQLTTTGSCQNCDLSGATLTRINLSNADLTGANLSNTNFTNANLTNAKIVNTDLRSSSFNGAIVDNTNLYGTQFYLSYFTKKQQNGIVYQQPIVAQSSSTKKAITVSKEEIFNAYFNAGYGYCDAQMLGKFWNTDPASAKLLAGKGLLRLPGFPSNIGGKLTSARQQYSGQGVCNYSSDFSYDDAVALANYWQVSIATAKTSLTGKLESGNLALAKDAVKKAHRSAKKQRK